jgi:hypothetical protein
VDEQRMGGREQATDDHAEFAQAAVRRGELPPNFFARGHKFWIVGWQPDFSPLPFCP